MEQQFTVKQHLVTHLGKIKLETLQANIENCIIIRTTAKQQTKLLVLLEEKSWF